MENKSNSELKFHLSYLPEKFKSPDYNTVEFMECSKRNSIKKDFYRIEDLLDFISGASPEELEGIVHTYYYSTEQQGYKLMSFDILKYLNINDMLEGANEKLGTEKFRLLENYKPYALKTEEVVLTPEITRLKDFFEIEIKDYNSTNVQLLQETLNSFGVDDLNKLIDIYGKRKHNLQQIKLQKVYESGMMDAFDYKRGLLDIILKIRSDYDPDNWPKRIVYISSDEFQDKYMRKMFGKPNPEDIKKHGEVIANILTAQRYYKHIGEISRIKDLREQGQISKEEYSSKMKSLESEFRNQYIPYETESVGINEVVGNAGNKDEDKTNILSELYWKNLRGEGLEKAVYDLLCKKYPDAKITLTQLSGDGGVDIFFEDITTFTATKSVIQCKGYEKPVGRPECQQILGAAQYHNSKAVIICPAGFTDNAREFAKKVHLQLIDSSDLVKLAIGSDSKV